MVIDKNMDMVMDKAIDKVMIAKVHNSCKNYHDHMISILHNPCKLT